MQLAQVTRELWPKCGHGAARENMKTAVYLHEFPYRIGAGGGTRTLKLFRAMAPKTIASANFATPAAWRS